MAKKSPSSAPAFPGLVAAYELMKLGVKPVVYEASQRTAGGCARRRSRAPEGVVAQLGGARASPFRRRPSTTTWTGWACIPSRSRTR